MYINYNGHKTTCKFGSILDLSHVIFHHLATLTLLSSNFQMFMSKIILFMIF